MKKQISNSCQPVTIIEIECKQITKHNINKIK